MPAALRWIENRLRPLRPAHGDLQKDRLLDGREAIRQQEALQPQEVLKTQAHCDLLFHGPSLWLCLRAARPRCANWRKRDMRLAFVLVSIGMAAASPVFAQGPESSISECDRLAASPLDSTRPAGVEGVRPQNVDAKTAVPACEAALKAAPTSSRIMFQLGRAYAAANEHVKARQQYASADALGHVTATNNLGAYFVEGLGGPRDLLEGRRLYEAAAAGLALAMYNAGTLYEEGKGVPKEYARAWSWYERAAKADYPPAMERLGLFSLNGWGVTKDTAEAMRWFEKAAALGDPAAMFRLGSLFHVGSTLPRDYATALRWYEKAASLGEVRAMNNLGAMYQDGNGVVLDYAEARRWFEKAAAAGFALSMKAIGEMHYLGQGTPRNFQEAR